MRFPGLLCATVGLLTLGGAAFAQETIDYTWPGSPSGSVTYKAKDGSSKTVDNVYLGPVNAVIEGVGPPSFPVYCVDLENDAVATTHVTTPGVFSGTGAYDSSVGGTYAELQMASWLIDKGVVTGGTTAEQNAGLQAAIWELIDGQFNTTGNYTVSGSNQLSVGNQTAAYHITTSDSTIIADGNDYLAQLVADLAIPNGDHGVADGTLFLVNRDIQKPATDGQDMLAGSGSFNPHVASTPEGASLLMFLPGLIPVAVGLRRRRNQSVGK